MSNMYIKLHFINVVLVFSLLSFNTNLSADEVEVPKYTCAKEAWSLDGVRLKVRGDIGENGKDATLYAKTDSSELESRKGLSFDTIADNGTDNPRQVCYNVSSLLNDLTIQYYKIEVEYGHDCQGRDIQKRGLQFRDQAEVYKIIFLIFSATCKRDRNINLVNGEAPD